MSDVKELKKMILLTAAYYNREIGDEVLSMMADDLMDLPISQLAVAFKSYRMNPNNRYFPMPAQIRDLINPVQSTEAEARAIAGRIQQAIVNHGYSNPEHAKELIGDVGWKIVQSYGGWSYLCQSHGIQLDPGIFAAQVRDRAQGMLKNEFAQNMILDHKEKKLIVSEREKTNGVELMSANEVIANILNMPEKFSKNNDTQS